MRKQVCLWCQRNVGEVRLVVNVAQEFAREAPAGVFHITGASPACFDAAVEEHRRKLADAEIVVGME